jgi:hypothetical protein
MSDQPAVRVLRRKAQNIDYNKILDTFREQNIIDHDFTGDLHFSFNRGGVSGCKKIENLK